MSLGLLSDCCRLASLLIRRYTGHIERLLPLLLLDESAARVTPAIMLRSWPLIRAFPESPSICKVDVIISKAERDRRKRGGKREIMIFSGDLTPTLFAFPL